MFRKHRTTIAASILLPSGIALATACTWFWRPATSPRPC